MSKPAKAIQAATAIALAIFLRASCARAQGVGNGTVLAPATPPPGQPLITTGSGTPGMSNGLASPNRTDMGATNLPVTNYFTPYGNRGFYQFGTNGGFLRGTNGFYQPGTPGHPGDFVPDGGELYERGPDGKYYRYEQDESRGVYRNGVLYSPSNTVAPSNSVPMNVR